MKKRRSANVVLVSEVSYLRKKKRRMKIGTLSQSTLSLTAMMILVDLSLLLKASLRDSFTSAISLRRDLKKSLLSTKILFVSSSSTLASVIS